VAREGEPLHSATSAGQPVEGVDGERRTTARWARLAPVVALVGALALHEGGARAQGDTAKPTVSDTEVDAVLAHFSHEPTVREIQIAAVNYYQVNPVFVQSLRTRARYKALVPSISVGVHDDRATFNRALDDIIFRRNGIKELEQQQSSVFGWSASASWGFDRLVFNAEELDVLSLIGIQDGVVREVTTVYFIRRRLQVNSLLNPPTSLAARISDRIRLEELTGLLDALTGGFMTRKLKEAEAARLRRQAAPGAGPEDG
jgi:hypothetical protein